MEASTKKASELMSSNFQLRMKLARKKEQVLSH
jgi:hypothetical protein